MKNEKWKMKTQLRPSPGGRCCIAQACDKGFSAQLALVQVNPVIFHISFSIFHFPFAASKVSVNPPEGK